MNNYPFNPKKEVNEFPQDGKGHIFIERKDVGDNNFSDKIEFDMGVIMDSFPELNTREETIDFVKKILPAIVSFESKIVVN